MGHDEQNGKDYRIEVSGWDSDDKFFVEKTEVIWTESGTKKTNLRHPLPDGTVVFIRLLAPSSPGSSYPVPYQIQNLGTMNRAGVSEVCLTQLRPRTNASETRQESAADRLLAPVDLPMNASAEEARHEA